MKANSIFSLIILASTITTTTPAHADTESKNLISNSSFSKSGISGDPLEWFRGGYGDNAHTHSFIPCSVIYTENDLDNTSDESFFVFRPDCPPNTQYRLETTLNTNTYFNGDTKWYFRDIKINPEKEHKLSYYYQPYTYSAQAIIRYTLKNGNYKYVLIADMPQLVIGGNGYVGWSKAYNSFVTPKNAKSLTVFFAITGNRTCNSSCVGPDRGILSIANVSLTKQQP